MKNIFATIFRPNINIDSKKRFDKLTIIISVLVISTIIAPMVLLRENYIFTIHDYLDSWPSLFEVLRRSGLFWKPDAPMPILQGMSTCYLYFDFGIYRLLNYLFGFIYGEIINKLLAILLGYFFTWHMLKYVLSDDIMDNRNIKLLALAYAISPVYPVWSISFAVLPLLLEVFLRYYKKPEEKLSPKILLFLLFGFMVYFPCIGIFVIAVWGIGLIIGLMRYKRLNIRLLASMILMTISSMIFNVNILIYVLRGDLLNRNLQVLPSYNSAGTFLRVLIKETGKAFLTGHYHAKPILFMILPVSLVGLAILFFQRRKLVKKGELDLLKAGFLTLFMIIVFSFVKGVDETGILPSIFSKVLPVLSGFAFWRMMYFNNILWYVLFGIIATLFSRWNKGKIVFGILIISQLMFIIFYDGLYYDTAKNLFHKNSLENGEITYKEFFDTEYFDALKEHIGYHNEGVVSFGFEPAVAMYNGFNTLDGYLCINPLDYHNSFREIIAPALKQNPAWQESYDTWGGRIYVFSKDYGRIAPVQKGKMRYYNDAEEQELYINTDVFEEMSGKYILSKYIISNAEDLKIILVDNFKSVESIYHVYVYAVE